MGIKYEDIKQANDAIKITDIKGKDYAEVNQRIKAFRMLYPEGTILTELVSNENGTCVMRATVGYEEEGTLHILGTGTAYEKEGSTFINKTSYIENCETSAVGRALGMAGLGIDTSIASAEEVQNAIANQTEKKATPSQVKFLKEKYEGQNLEKLLKANNLAKLEDMPMTKASDIISKIKEKSNG
jgi:hypothetical protein